MTTRRALAALSTLVTLLASCRGESARQARPAAPGAPVILISIDTLRSDHLPPYGYKGVETPAIDRLARDGLLFEDAWSQCPLTLPSHVSIFTGLNPPAHGVRDNIGYRLDAKAHPTLTRLLKDRGYATGGAVSAWVLRGPTGLSDSFDFYDDAIEPPRVSQAASQIQRPGTETVSRALAWAEGIRGRPFFLFVHLYEPHSPYEPPEPYRSRYVLPYDGEIAAADAVVGTLLRRLVEWNLYDRSVIVLLSDHGEGLMDHGEQEHGILLYREALQVPLIVKLPGSSRRGERIGRPVALTDVLATIVALAGGPAPPGLPGRNLLDPGPDPPAAIYGETFYPRIHLGWSELRSLADARYHYIDGPEPELYDLRGDPREKADLFGKEGRVARAMKRGLDRYPVNFAAQSPVDLEEAKKLAALGYLSVTSRAGKEGPLPSPAKNIGLLADIKEAFRLEAAGERERAIAALRTLLHKNPRLFDVQYKLAEMLAAEKRFREAAEAYRQAIRISPSVAGQIALALARVGLELGELKEAEENAQLALRESPAEAHEVLARVALARGDLDGVERESRQMKGNLTLESTAAVLLAEVRLRRDRPQEALAVLDSALSRLREKGQTPPANLQFLRGDALARLARYSEAEAAFDEEIRTYPENSDAYARLAVVYALEHRLVKEVYRVLEAMHSANPAPDTALLAAKTLDSLGDTRAAAAWRRRANSSR